MVYGVVVLVYLAFLVGVALLGSRKVHNQDDFMVAGRRLSTPILVGTLLATWTGSGSILGGAGLAYERGFAGLWFNAGALLGMVGLIYLAPRVRRFARYTIPDILETRYNATTRVLGTITTVIAYTGIVSYQFRAGGMVLELVTGIPAETGIILTAIFVIGYTAIAGLISVAYTDVVNGVVMLLGLTFGLPILVDAVGGIEGWTQTLPASHFSVMGDFSWAEILAVSVPGMLLVLGEGNLYQRFFSARDTRTARRAAIYFVLGVLVIDTLIVTVAVLGSAMFPGIEPESIILHVARNGLPLWVGCGFFAAVVAIIISTADSFLLVPSTNLVRDVYQRFINPDAPQERILRYARWMVVGLGVVAWVQVRFFDSVMEMVLYAYTIYGVGITPPTLAAFLWRRATATGGMLSLAGGMITTVLWEILGRPGDISTVFPALFVSCTCLVVGSLLTPPPAPEQWRPFMSPLSDDDPS